MQRAACLLVLLSQALAERPICQVTVGSSSTRACGYIEHSDACCVEPLATRPVANWQRHQTHTPHTNVTFSGIVHDALYLVSHDDDCGRDHACWEVSPGPMGPLEALGAAGDPAYEAEVAISFLAGPKPYNVSLTTATVSRAGVAGAESADCKLLRASNPVLDIVGHNATVRLVPPLGPDGAPISVARALPGVNVSLHSGQCPFSCQDFKVAAQCRRGEYARTDLYMTKPFEDTLVITNVTRFGSSSPARATVGPGGPLLFHCARVFLRGCVVATATVAVRIRPPSVPVEVTVLASQSDWGSTLPALGVLGVLGVLCLLALVALVTLFALALWRQRLLGLQPFGYFAERGSGPSSPPSPPPAPRGAPLSPSASKRRLLLLYYKPPVSEPGATRALSGAMRALARVVSAYGQTEVVDMYDDALLLEDGAVLRASSFLGDASASVLLVATPALEEALRSAPDADPFQAFVSSVVLGLGHAPERAAGRVFTLSLDCRHHPSALLGLPVTAVYVLPYHLPDLLHAVPGLSTKEVKKMHSQADEQALRRYIKQYIQQKSEASIIAEV